MDWVEFIGKVLVMYIAIGFVSGFCLVHASMPVNGKEPTIKYSVIWGIILMICDTCLVLFAEHNLTFPL